MLKSYSQLALRSILLLPPLISLRHKREGRKMCECAETYGHSHTHTHTHARATTQAVSTAMATSRCENTERAIMCNMLSNSIAPSLSLPFVTPNLSPPPSSPHVPISVASACVLPATRQLDLSVVHILLPSASHAFMKKGQIFNRANNQNHKLFFLVC